MEQFQIIKTIKADEEKQIHLVQTYDNKKVIMKEYLDDKRDIYSVLKGLSADGIPKIYDIEFSDKTVVFEEYVSGASLFEIISSGRPLDENTASSIFRQLANILKQIQRVNIIHRDIKPENIIISDNGKVYLTDFDAARFYRPYAQKDTRLLGTEGYAAPEQYGYAATDFRTDIFNLGSTMRDVYTYINCKNPYQKIIDKCTEIDPKRRYSNAEQLIKSINDCDFSRKYSKKVIAVIAAIVICVAAVFFVKTFSDNSKITPSSSPTEGIVYLTPTGKKYHYSKNCAGDNAIKTTLEIAIEEGKQPCAKCTVGN